MRTRACVSVFEVVSAVVCHFFFRLRVPVCVLEGQRPKTMVRVEALFSSSFSICPSLSSPPLSLETNARLDRLIAHRLFHVFLVLSARSCMLVAVSPEMSSVMGEDDVFCTHAWLLLCVCVCICCGGRHHCVSVMNARMHECTKLSPPCHHHHHCR